MQMIVFVPADWDINPEDDVNFKMMSYSKAVLQGEIPVRGWWEVELAKAEVAADKVVVAPWPGHPAYACERRFCVLGELVDGKPIGQADMYVERGQFKTLMKHWDRALRILLARNKVHRYSWGDDPESTHG